MTVPSLFTDSFVNDFFDNAFDRTPSLFHATGSTQMSADVKEFKDHYELSLELPGYSKDNVRASLKDGYLTIQASREEKNDQTDEENGKYIRRERFSGTLERTFYIGEDVKPENIKAKFENGVLEIDIPKVEAQPEVDTSRSISID